MVSCHHLKGLPKHFILLLGYKEFGMGFLSGAFEEV
jgi:hypothetical protein